MSYTKTMVDPKIFEALKSKVEEETKVREELSSLVQALERDTASAQGLLTRIHSTPKAKLSPLIAQIEEAIKAEIVSIGKLAEYASNHPYYKYNFKWTRAVKDAIVTMILCGWLGGMATESKPGEMGRLITIEEVGEFMNVPVNVKDRDTFHITVEEYLLSLMDAIEELSRLAMNAVTLGDIDVTVKISTFIKDLYASFQLLNLKNDIVRKKFDGLKYHVKKVEDVIYDLSLRNLIPKPEASGEES